MTTHPDDAAFIRAVCAAPADTLPRLMWADFLDETAGVVPCERCQLFEAGDLVEAVPPNVLRCGSGRYSHAVVVSVTPFALTSEAGDMLWTATQRPGMVRKVGRVANYRNSKAAERWRRDCRQYATTADCPACRGDGRVGDGRSERAAFIRVQCELAKPRTPVCDCGHDSANGLCGRCRTLRRREAELLTLENAIRWTPNRAAFAVPDQVRFRRGFVEELTLSAADWLRHAEPLTAATPVTAVTLTDWPEITAVELAAEHVIHFVLTGAEWRSGVRYSLRELHLHPDRELIRADPRGFGRTLAADVLKAAWSNITFTLPPPGRGRADAEISCIRCRRPLNGPDPCRCDPLTGGERDYVPLPHGARGYAGRGR